MAGRESHGMDGFGGDPCRGFPQAPAVRIHRNVEVTPAEVGICAAGYPRHRRQLWPSKEGAVGDFRSGFIQSTGGGNTEARGYLPASKTGGIGPSRSNYERP